MKRLIFLNGRQGGEISQFGNISSGCMLLSVQTLKISDPESFFKKYSFSNVRASFNGHLTML
jgi:hypothetical protein